MYYIYIYIYINTLSYTYTYNIIHIYYNRIRSVIRAQISLRKYFQLHTIILCVLRYFIFTYVYIYLFIIYLYIYIYSFIYVYMYSVRLEAHEVYFYRE